MQGPARRIGVALLLLVPGLATEDAHAKMMSGPGWQCHPVGIGVGGGDINWGWHCISAGGGGGTSAGGPPGGGGGGGGGANNGAQPPATAKEQETDDRIDASSCGETAGNPVVLYTGNKVEPELDFAAGGEMGLYLRRTYNRMWSGVGSFGKHWLSTFDYSLAFSSGMAWAQRPDGRRIKFVAVPGNRWNAEKGRGCPHHQACRRRPHAAQRRARHGDLQRGWLHHAPCERAGREVVLRLQRQSTSSVSRIPPVEACSWPGRTAS